jgi:hypothetical protein
MKKRVLIGAEDRVDLLELHLMDVNAKSDPLAHFSLLYCTDIKEVIVRGQKRVNFWLLNLESGMPINEKFSFVNYTKSISRREGGKSIAEFMIQTTIVIFDKLYVIDFLLAKRQNETCQIVLGNDFLDEQFTLDPKGVNLSFNHKNALRI